MKYIPPTLRGTVIGFLVLVPLLYVIPLAALGRWQLDAVDLVSGPIEAARIWLVTSVVAWPFTILPTTTAAFAYFFVVRLIHKRYGDGIHNRLRLVAVYAAASGFCCALSVAAVVVAAMTLSTKEVQDAVSSVLGWAFVSFLTGALIGVVFGLSAIPAPNKRLQPIAREDARSG